MAGVGTRKRFENERVVVWDLDLEPGERTGPHTHARPYVVRILAGSVLEVFDGTGASLGKVELEVGRAVSFRIDGDKIVADRPGYPVVPVTHSAQNVGSKSYREVLVEFKELES